MNETAIARTDDEPVLIRPSRESDVEAMLAIYRYHIRSGVPCDVEGTGAPEPDDLRDRRKNLKQTRLPHLVATYRGEVVGYAYAVLFRKRPAYRYTAKHSIYVHHEHLARGVGRLLLQGMIDACAAAGFRQMIGYIDADNAPSLALHEKFGFARAGLLCGVAYRNGHWRDTVMTQRWLGAGVTSWRPAARPSRRKVSRSDLDAVGMQRPVVQRLVLAKPCLRPLSGFVLVGSVDLERALAHLDLPAVLAEHVLHEPDHIS